MKMLSMSALSLAIYVLSLSAYALKEHEPLIALIGACPLPLFLAARTLNDWFENKERAWAPRAK